MSASVHQLVAIKDMLVKMVAEICQKP